MSVQRAPEQSPAGKQDADLKRETAAAGAGHVAAGAILVPGSSSGGGFEALVALGLEPQTAMEALAEAHNAMGLQRGRSAPRITAQQAGNAAK